MSIQEDKVQPTEFQPTGILNYKEKLLWQAVRRGLLAVVAAIDVYLAEPTMTKEQEEYYRNLGKTRRGK